MSDNKITSDLLRGHTDTMSISTANMTLLC